MILADADRMTKRRVRAKAKVYGFSPWVDQVDAINQIMKETGERTESAVLRKLVDEALVARRKNGFSVHPIRESDNDSGRRREKIEALLMHLVGQGDVAFRILDMCLALLQDVLAESHAARRLSWEFLLMPRFREQEIDAKEAERRFMAQLDQARNYAYAAAERIKESQEREMT